MATTMVMAELIIQIIKFCLNKLSIQVLFYDPIEDWGYRAINVIEKAVKLTQDI